MMIYLSNLNLSSKDEQLIINSLNNQLDLKKIDKDIFWSKFSKFIETELDLSNISVKSKYLIKVGKNYIEEHIEELKPVYLDYTFNHIYKTELKPLGFNFTLEEIITIELIESKMLTKLGSSCVSSITELNEKIGQYLKDRNDITFKSFLRCLLKSQLLNTASIEINLLEIVKQAKKESNEWNETLKQLKGEN